MKKNKKIITGENENFITDLKYKRLIKNILEETDPDCREEIEDFLKRYSEDTLTGL